MVAGGGVGVLVSRRCRAAASYPEVSPTSRGLQVARTGPMPWVLPLLCPRSSYCNATCPGMSQVVLSWSQTLSVQICAVRYSWDL